MSRTDSRPTYAPDAILRIGWRRKWQIVLPAIVIAATASAWIHRLPDSYRSQALLLVVPQPVPESFVRSTVTARADARLQAIIQQILSRTELERIIRDFDLYAERRTVTPMQDVVDSMRTRDLEIRPVKGDTFRLGFAAGSPEVAMRVVERLVSLFIHQTSLDRATVAENTDQFLEAQLQDARSRLVDNETRLGEYQRRHNGELPTQFDANVRGVHNTEVQLQVLADSLNRDRDRQLMLERALKDASLTDPRDAGAGAARAAGAPLTAAEQLQKAEAALRDMHSTLTEHHPDVVAMKGIADLRMRAAAERARVDSHPDANDGDPVRQGRLEDARAELAAVQRQVAQKTADAERLRATLLTYQHRIEAAPARASELAALTRDYETLQQTYRGLLAKKQESQIAANLERQQVDAHFKVLDPARLPERPFAPNRTRLYGIGFVVALGFGVMFAGLLERFDRRLRTEAVVRAALSLPVLAAIPLLSPRRRFVRRAAVVMSVGVVIAACAGALAWRLFT
jgi:polysaccharide chain length determinant protein (PEP-CTERM system associated)